MKKLFSLTTLCLALVACDNGISEESSRQPKGNPNAVVTVLEFADLQCPACRAAHTSVVQPLLTKYGNDIVYHHMHFPLRSIHRYALEASEAAECAADQGKFWEYVDIACTRQDDMNSDTLNEWAQELGVDMQLYEKCIRSRDKRDTILADYKQGREIGVAGTPTFFVNGQKTEATLEALSAAIDAELERLTQRL